MTETRHEITTSKILEIGSSSAKDDDGEGGTNGEDRTGYEVVLIIDALVVDSGIQAAVETPDVKTG